MNLRQGRIGRQEALCAAAIAAAASGIFTPDGRELYTHGNSAYLSMLLSAGLALVAFLFAAGAMRRAGCETLCELLRKGLGAIFGRAAALLLCVLLLVAAASVLSRFSLMLSRFVYPDAAEWQILAYLIPASFLPAWFGLEGVGRAARLFLWFILAMLLGALVMAAYNYELHRLAPFLGDGTPHLLDMGVRNSLLFFPALIGLLVVARGVHGTVAARRAGYGAGIVAGVLSALCQLCLGMTYPYSDLAQMHSPMYRITMNFRTGGYFPRLDKLLLFGWVLSGMLASGYYIYTAALLFAESFAQEDIRPTVVAFSALAGALSLLLHVEAAFVESVVSVLSVYGWIIAIAPVMLASVLCALFHRAGGKEANA